MTKTQKEAEVKKITRGFKQFFQALKAIEEALTKLYREYQTRN